MSDYKKYLIHECGWHKCVPFGSLDHVHEVVCPDCGAAIPKRASNLDKGWKLCTAKLVLWRTRPFVWWQPSTWWDTDWKFEFPSNE